MNRIRKASNFILNKKNYLKNRTVCKGCYNKTGRKKNFLIQNQQPKIENVNNNNSNNNRNVIIGFTNCGKTDLMNLFVLRKQELTFINTQSLDQYLKIKAQTSDEIQPLEIYENSTVVSDHMLLSKQKKNIDLYFTRGRHNKIDIYYISQRYFHLPKILFVKNLM